MTVESWNALFQWAAVGLLALTFFVGAGALVTSNLINARQTERLLTLELELASAKTALAEQQERAAKAESELMGVQKAIAPRSLDPQTFVRELRGRRKAAAVDIAYNPNDHEAYLLAVQLRRWLGPGNNGDGLNWGTVPEVRPMTQRDAVGPLANMAHVPPALRTGAMFGGLAVAVKQLEGDFPDFFKAPEDMEPAVALALALQRAGIPSVSLVPVPSFREGYIRIMVGQKIN